LREIEVTIQNQPDDFLAANTFGYFRLAAMGAPVAICELGADVVGASFNFFRPPSTNIIDGFEDIVCASISSAQPSSTRAAPLKESRLLEGGEVVAVL
jgi:hypothetical protein